MSIGRFQRCFSSLVKYAVVLVLGFFTPIVNCVSFGSPFNHGISANSQVTLSGIKGKADIVIAESHVVGIKDRLRKSLKTVGPILAASFCAAAIMYPLDLVRALQMANVGKGTEVQLSTIELLTNFKKRHGIQGFFTQGLAPELLRSTWMRFLKFSLFPVVHYTLFKGVPESKGTPYSKAIAAIVSAVPEALSIMPLEIAKVSLQLDTTNRFKNNMFAAMESVYRERGLSGFMIGYTGVQYRQAAWSAGYFASIKLFDEKITQVFDMLKLSGNTKGLTQLLSGFLAGVFGALLNTPGDTIRTIVQKQILAGTSKVGYPTFLTVGREIVDKGGIGALYTGLSMKSLHLGGGGALMAFFIPLFKDLFEKMF